MVADALAPCVTRPSEAIDCVGLLVPCFQRERISATHTISLSVLRNGRQCKCILLFPETNSAYKGLKCFTLLNLTGTIAAGIFHKIATPVGQCYTILPYFSKPRSGMSLFTEAYVCL